MADIKKRTLRASEQDRPDIVGNYDACDAVLATERIISDLNDRLAWWLCPEKRRMGLSS